MALYACEEDDRIHASDAKQGVIYWCLECWGPLKVRRQKRSLPHFYHLRAAPSCRLYSKSEDHLLLQLEIQKMFPPGALNLEYPFSSIQRIADLLWEEEKIVFEIQCSHLQAGEALQRQIDYEKKGYRLIWLLDDRVFNRRFFRPAEQEVRTWGAYYIHFQRVGSSLFYDQFEIALAGRRLKKGRPLSIDLRTPRERPVTVHWPSAIPSCLAERFNSPTPYFRKDLIDRALRSTLYPSYRASLEHWHTLEIELKKAEAPPHPLKYFFNRYIKQPYLRKLDSLLETLCY